MSNKVADLESRRDKLAGDIAELQARLDGLSGNEELVSVQKIVNDIDASGRLLAALDRQIAQVRETQRLAAIEAMEAAVEAAAAQTAKIDADIATALWRVFELVERRVAVTEVSPRLGRKSAVMRARVLDMMGNVGIDLSAGVGTGAFPVRK